MTNPSDMPRTSQVEVITSVERRRRYTAEERRAFIEEAAQPGMSISLVARKYGISPSQLFRWRRRLQEGGLVAVHADDDVVPAAELKRLENELRQLQRLVGKLTLQNEILKEGIRVGREKKLISRKPLHGIEDFQ